MLENSGCIFIRLIFANSLSSQLFRSDFPKIIFIHITICNGKSDVPYTRRYFTGFTVLSLYVILKNTFGPSNTKDFVGSATVPRTSPS